MALLERDAYLRGILEVIPDAVVVIDDSGLIQTFSDAAERIFGYPRGEALGRNISMLMPAPYQERHDRYISHYLDTGEPHILGNGRVIVGKRKDETVFPIELNVAEIHADGRRLFIGFVRDLTERQAVQKRLQELQEELAHVTRLSILGEMASVLAHELNQPLTAIGTYLGAANRLMEGPVTAAVLGPLLNKASEQAFRAGEIIRRLRSFIKKEPTKRALQDVNRTIEEAAALGLIGAKSLGISASLVLAPDVPSIPMDRIAIQQVVLNLIRNAVDAMAGSPTRSLMITTRLASDMVEIGVTDSGPGIAAEIGNRLFHPFVTTKADGIGIGLAVCSTIIENHRGRLWAEANPQGGTIFRVALPITDDLEEQESSSD